MHPAFAPDDRHTDPRQGTERKPKKEQKNLDSESTCRHILEVNVSVSHGKVSVRVDEEIKHAGEFWSPDKPEDKFSGILTISDGGDIKLEISADKSAFVDFNEVNVGRIVGRAEKIGYVTLEGGFYLKRNFSFGSGDLANSLLRINKAFLGVGYDAGETALFSNFTFYLEGLDEWLGVSGIKVSYSDDFKTSTITYEPVEDISAFLDSGEEIKIRFGYTLPGLPTTTEAKITQGAYFLISAETPKEIGHFIEIAHKLSNLLCFATGKTLTAKDVLVTLPLEPLAAGGNPPRVRVYYASLPYSEVKPKVDRHEVLFSYRDVSSRWEHLLRSWFGAYERLSPALSLYFSTQNGTHKYLDSKFLSLAQCLETFSRRTNSESQMEEGEFLKLRAVLMAACPKVHEEWLEGKLRYANEINLTKRLAALFAPFDRKFGKPKAVKSLVRKIVVTRNYLTHFDESTEGDAVKGRGLWVLCMRLEALFELSMLNLLGFKVDEVEALCDQYGVVWRKITAD